jgi:F-type H+-transporting ATPase subunit delta
MADSRVAYRYVKSLLQLAVEQNALEAVHADMLLFDKVCRQNRAFTLMLRNPVIRHDKKRDVLTELFKDKVHPLTMAIFNIITRKNREPLLPEIARQFHQAYNQYKGIVTASLEMAVEPDNTLLEEFRKLIKIISHKNEVELLTRLKPDMIGGFILTVNDRQIDASVRNHLKALERQLTYNPYIKSI